MSKKSKLLINPILFFIIMFLIYIVIKNWDDFKLGIFGGY